MRSAKPKGGCNQNSPRHGYSRAERLPQGYARPRAYYRGTGVKMLYEYTGNFTRKNIPQDELDRLLPPLTLQLLIENVIKHNIISLSKPMEVKLTTEVRDKEVWLSVSNPIKLKQGVASSGKGLMNLSQRYKLLCNRELIIENNKNKFVIKVPLLYE